MLTTELNESASRAFRPSRTWFATMPSSSRSPPSRTYPLPTRDGGRWPEWLMAAFGLPTVVACAFLGLGTATMFDIVRPAVALVAGLAGLVALVLRGGWRVAAGTAAGALAAWVALEARSAALWLDTSFYCGTTTLPIECADAVRVAAAARAHGYALIVLAAQVPASLALCFGAAHASRWRRASLVALLMVGALATPFWLVWGGCPLGGTAHP